ncbi:MAG TPA: hypothetical protein VMX18_01010 [Candidatus Bipolaricaulota bacterium]|nr:hypothetical protein [Candidatus Bipolaricaulota bacterium]
MKKLSILFAIAIMVLTMSAGCGKKLAPDDVLDNMIKSSIEDVKTYRFDGVLTAKTTTPDPSGAGVETTFKIDMTGAYDGTDKQAPKIDAALTGNIEVQGLSMNVAGDARLLDDKTYFRLRELPALIPLGIETNQWFYTNIDKTSTEAGVSSLSLDHMATIQKLMQEYRIFRITEDLGSAEVNGVKTYHYKTKMDRDEFKAFMEALAKQQGQEFTDKDRDDLDQVADNLDNMNMEMWIGQKDFFLYKLTMSVPFKSDTEVVDLSVEMTMKDYNSNVQITAPEGALEYVSEGLGIFNDFK